MAATYYLHVLRPGSSESTASGSSPPLSTSSSLLSVMRTPLSSKAKPFQSMNVATEYDIREDSEWPDMWPGVPYSEEQQHQACAGLRGSHGTNFSDCVPNSRPGVQVWRASKGQDAEKPLRMPSRTPSPVPRQEINAENVSSHPEIRVGSCFMSALEQTRFKQTEQKQVASCSTKPCSYLTIKNTFFHYCFDDEATGQQASLNRCSSAPGGLDRLAGSKHDSGTCKPCAYFFGKDDGCRQGDSCGFCHLCPPGMIKQKKKEKIQIMKAHRKAQQSE